MGPDLIQRIRDTWDDNQTRVFESFLAASLPMIRAKDTSAARDEGDGRGAPMELVDDVDDAPARVKKRESTRRKFNFVSRKKGRSFEEQ